MFNAMLELSKPSATNQAAEKSHPLPHNTDYANIYIQYYCICTLYYTAPSPPVIYFVVVNLCTVLYFAF